MEGSRYSPCFNIWQTLICWVVYLSLSLLNEFSQEAWGAWVFQMGALEESLPRLKCSVGTRAYVAHPVPLATWTVLASVQCCCGGWGRAYARWGEQMEGQIWNLNYSYQINFSLFPKTELFYLSHKLVDLYPSNPVSNTISLLLFVIWTLRKYFASM